MDGTGEEGGENDAALKVGGRGATPTGAGGAVKGEGRLPPVANGEAAGTGKIAGMIVGEAGGGGGGVKAAAGRDPEGCMALAAGSGRDPPTTGIGNATPPKGRGEAGGAAVDIGDATEGGAETLNESIRGSVGGSGLLASCLIGEGGGGAKDVAVGVT